jgi:hypothetical protein
LNADDADFELYLKSALSAFQISIKTKRHQANLTSFLHYKNKNYFLIKPKSTKRSYK